jgi:hypothetical protein
MASGVCEREHKTLHPLIISVLSLDEEWTARRWCRSVRQLFISKYCFPQPSLMTIEPVLLRSVSANLIRHFEVTPSCILCLADRNWTNLLLTEMNA